MHNRIDVYFCYFTALFMWQNLIDQLTSRLSEPLPGLTIQEKMSPIHRDIPTARMRKNGEVKQAAVLILLYQHGHDVFFPLIRRQEYNGAHSGQISLPGGRLEQGESFEEAALRETAEEIGIPADQVMVIGELSKLYIWASNYEVVPIVGFLEQEPVFKREEREVAEVISTPLHALLSEEIIKEKQQTIQGKYEIRYPYYDYQGNVIWGATAMMLSEFFYIVGQTNFLK